MKILKTVWIGNFGYNILGIIKAQDEITEKINFYVGIGKGFSEEQDITLILAGGQKYTEEQFKDYFKEFLGE